MKSLVKKCEINAGNDKVFEALTEPINIREWSGDEAVMDLNSGGKFSLWGGSIHGENVEVSRSRIVQKWKEKNWDKYSDVIFNITEENDKTMVELIHNDIPDSSFGSINEGWDKYYLGSLKSFLEA